MVIEKYSQVGLRANFRLLTFEIGNEMSGFLWVLEKKPKVSSTYPLYCVTSVVLLSWARSRSIQTSE